MGSDKITLHECKGMQIFRHDTEAAICAMDGTLEDFWNQCSDPWQLCCVAQFCGVNDRYLIKASVECAELVVKHSGAHSERLKSWLRVARLWAMGYASLYEVMAARDCADRLRKEIRGGEGNEVIDTVHHILCIIADDRDSHMSRFNVHKSTDVPDPIIEKVRLVKECIEYRIIHEAASQKIEYLKSWKAMEASVA